jgi:hypothetical protein
MLLEANGKAKPDELRRFESLLDDGGECEPFSLKKELFRFGSHSLVFKTFNGGDEEMASTKQKGAARRNVQKAASAAKKKRTIAHLPKSVRTALGKQASSVAKKKRRAKRGS